MSSVEGNQKHMAPISLEVEHGFKNGDGRRRRESVVLGYVSKAKCLRNNARCFAE